MSLDWRAKSSLTDRLYGGILTGTMSVAPACARCIRVAGSPDAASHIRSPRTEVRSFADPHRREPFAYHVSFLRSALARGPPNVPQSHFHKRICDFCSIDKEK